MQISSAGFEAAGNEQGFAVFSRESVKAGTAFDVAVSGSAPPEAAASAAAPDQANGHDSGPGPTIEIAPARLDGEKWILLGSLAAIFAVGVGLLLRQPVQAAVSGPAAASPSSAKGRKAQRRAAQSKDAGPAPPLVEQINREVNTNLDSLKDTLLRIELRRQAGTISDEDYARERGHAEQMLRDLVQG
jgi:pyruvate/2-oxoglutarate dehydrogenase complex dihydrolipoamide acyltransferase (E2) component